MGPFTFSVTAAINLWTSAAIDLFLSATLIAALRKRVLGFNRATDGVIRRLMRTAATTASYTAVFSTIAAALSATRPASSLTGATNFLVFSIPVSSLYALSMLATLAARKPLTSDEGVVKFSSAVTASDPWGAARARAGLGVPKVGRAVSRQLGRQVSRSLAVAGLGRAPVGAQRGEGQPQGCMVQVKIEREMMEDVGRAEHGLDTRRVRSRSKVRSGVGVGGGAGGGGGGSAVVLSAGEKRRPSVQYVEVPCAT